MNTSPTIQSDKDVTMEKVEGYDIEPMIFVGENPVFRVVNGRGSVVDHGPYLTPEDAHAAAQALYLRDQVIRCVEGRHVPDEDLHPLRSLAWSKITKMSINDAKVVVFAVNNMLQNKSPDRLDYNSHHLACDCLLSLK